MHDNWVQRLVRDERDYMDSDDPTHALYMLHNMDYNRISHRAWLSPAYDGIRDRENLALGRYWRFISVVGLFPKTTNDTVDERLLMCDRGTDNPEGVACGGDDTKELRFCAVVTYTRPYQGTVVLCSVMTNFLE